jgi:hypothetical protein
LGSPPATLANVAPKPSPAATPQPNVDANPTRIAEMKHFLVNNKISHPDTFSNPSTAQSKAATFLAIQDELALPIPENQEAARRLVQRYVLTVFYYALDGPEWKDQLNFLSPEDSCFWFSKITLSPTEVYSLGASCSDTPKVVDSLLIRKCCNAIQCMAISVI